MPANLLVPGTQLCILSHGETILKKTPFLLFRLHVGSGTVCRYLDLLISGREIDTYARIMKYVPYSRLKLHP